MKKTIYLFVLLSIFCLSDVAAGNTTSIQPPPTPPDCAGDNGVLRMFFYNEIIGRYLSDLEGHPRYPNSPSGVVTLDEFDLLRFNINYGGIVRGYLLAPETGDYSFEITAHNQSSFQLSADEDPENLSTGMHIIEGVTADLDSIGSVNLVEGNYYYFEYKNKSHGGYNFTNLRWKVPSNAAGNWAPVDIDAAYDYTCETICNLSGTPCDDGDSNTIDDREDGNCNCYGRMETTNSCIGESGGVTALYYEGITGSAILDMENDSSFPASPSSAESLRYIYKPNDDFDNYYGTWIKGYFYIPVTGEYTFNIISDDEGKAWLSSGESSDAADLSLIGHVPGFTGFTDHDKYASQTSTPMTLQAGQYYYFELKHKENGGGDFYKMFWKTPFLDNNKWHYIAGSYLHLYDCETEACVPAGTICDDGDNNTYNDQYDDDCNCVGMPCVTPDCISEETYFPYDACDITQQHTNQLDAWQSCEIMPSPNPARGDKHWIMYDLAALYQIHDTHIWNYNMENETGKGIKEVAIDISLDGTTWTELGTYTWAEASGESTYEGFAGTDYGGAIGQYLLITALSTWDDGSCAGFSELQVNMETCPDVDTPCDDNDPTTFNDVYNELCECQGEIINSSVDSSSVNLLAFSAKWDEKNVLVEWTAENEAANTLYEVQRSLDAKNFESIGMLNAKDGSDLKNAYQLVDTKAHQLANELFYRLKIIDHTNQERFSHVVSLYQSDRQNRLSINDLRPNPFKDVTTIEFTVPMSSAHLQILVYNNQGHLIRTLAGGVFGRGQHQVSWDGKDNYGKEVEAGFYYLQLTDGRQRVGRRVVKL